MLENITILLLLPLILSQFSFLAKKYNSWFFIIQILIGIICLEASISLGISQKIFMVDLGFFTLKFMCDIYSYFFGILVSVVWILTILYSHSYFNQEIHGKKITKFFYYICLTIFCTYGNAYSGNLETFFIFYFLMILLTAPLIVLSLNKSTARAYRLYLKTHIYTAIFLFLPAIILLKYFKINTDFVADNRVFLLENHVFASLIMFLFIFGVAKNCVLPFHKWITRSTVASTPVSALLHSVAAVKSGSFIIIKIVVYIYSLNYTKFLSENFFYCGWIFYLCGITAVYSAYRAYKTTKLKSRFAYSTISQLSYILSSIFIANKLAIMGAVLHIISHSLCKITLFFIAGIFSSVYGIHSTKDASKLAPHLKFWIACLAFCGASIIGIPYLPGSFGKDLMIISEMQTHHYSSVIFLICGSLINIFYIFPIIKAGFFTKTTSNKNLAKIPLSMRLAIIIAVSLALAMSYFINDLINFFKIYEV